MLRDARSGSAEALGRLLERCGPKLLAVIRARLGPGLRRQVESRDILQETYLKAFQRIEQFEGSGSEALMGWLAAIAANELRDRTDYYLRLKRDARLRLSWRSGFDPAARELHGQVTRIALQEEARLLEAAMDRLPPDQREAILLRRYEELAFKDVGARLGRSEDAARKLFARAMTALAMEMRALRAGSRGAGP